MPIFDFKCQVCGHVWESLVKGDEVPTTCPHAEDAAEHEETEWPAEKGPAIKKLPSVFGTHLSWSAWRVLDRK